MKIRTQLVLAFFLLAIVPLAGIVLYSYASSLDAVRAAMEEDGRALTDEMDERMASMRQDLNLRFAGLSELPFSDLLADGDGGAPAPLADRLARVMGDAAPIVESFEYIPAPPAPRAPPAAPAPAAVSARPKSPEPSAARRFPSQERRRRDLPSAPSDARSVVIDVPRILAGVGLQAAAETLGEEVPVFVEPGSAEAAHQAAVGLAYEIVGDLADDLRAERGRIAAEIQAAEAAARGGSLSSRERDALEASIENRTHVQQKIAKRLEGVVEAKRRLSSEERSALERRRHEQHLLFGEEFQVPIEEDGKVVGHLKACVASRDVLQEILRASVRGEGEVPFAVDRERNLYAADDDGLAVVESLALEADGEGSWRASGPAADDWVVATSREPDSGLTFGIARPIRHSLAEVRRTAARNFGYGLGLIVLGLIGIQPLSRRMTRQLDSIARGAERIAQGDLQTRLPVESRSEFGKLSSAFNRMAADLSVHQERLLHEESRRQERELQERLLLAEYRRKSEELEEARRFQLSLLPKQLPSHPDLELAVAMTTATEVGGDFYDYRVGEDGALTLAVGDATGHGARAGTMVTVIKSLFTAWSGFAGEIGAPARFLEEANRAIRRMDLGRMAMALVLARFDGRRLTLASAGMPPALIHRAAAGGGEGRVEEVVLSGMPLGGLDCSYREHEIELAPGDTVLLLSDGLCELPDANGDPMGYGAVRERFHEAAARGPRDGASSLEGLIADLEAAAGAWAGNGRQADDRTYVVVRVRA